MITEGTDKVHHFGDRSPVFKGVPPDRLCRLKYQILGSSSSRGYEDFHLNIYRLALYNRFKVELALQRGDTTLVKNGRFVRPE